MRITASIIAACAAMLFGLPAASFAADPQGPVAETKYGPVMGSVAEGLAVFKGVPYAASTIGEGRFAPPRDPEPWTEVRPALDFSEPCWQATDDSDSFAFHSGAPLSDDCLRVNIWAPKDASSDSNLPVYVYIHGGGFGVGAGSQAAYDGTALAKEGLVVVTLNYRLGAMGFLATQSDPNPSGSIGNYGILDQIKALEWVRDNIAAFGGDPQKVTIGGESAGSMSVSSLIVSPLAKGLFRGAIMESGTVFSLQSFPLGYGSIDAATGQGRLFLAALRLKDEPGVLEKLRNFDPAIVSSLAAFKTDWSSPPPFTLGPVLDGKVIPADPQAAMSEGDLNKVNVLIGFNADEASLFTESVNDASAARDMVVAMLGPASLDGLWAKYKPADKEAEITLAKKAVAMGLFSSGAKRVADLHSRHADVYMYNFEYVSSFGKEKNLGAYHTSELPFVFGQLEASGLVSEVEKRLAQDVRTRWVDFIKNGNPNEGAKPPTDIAWPTYDPSNPQALRMNAEFAVGPPLDLDMIDTAANILYGELPDR